MTKTEYEAAVRRARKVFGYVQLVDSKRPVRITKTGALSLARQVPDDAEINAMWADDDQAFLLVG